MHRPASEEVALWRRAMHDVRPLRSRQFESGAVPKPPPQAGEGSAATAARVEAGAGGTPAVPVTKPGANRVRSGRPESPPPLDRFAGVDRATATRLVRGRHVIEGRLDLHGMTQAEAHRALSGFVARSRIAGRRCLLVITGHGRNSGGVLKGAVPRWLHEPELRPHVLAIAPAQPRDGGTGALYVLLRRFRAAEAGC